MPYDMPTDLTADNGFFFGLAKWAYDVTDGIFWVVILASFAAVGFIAASRYTTERAFGFAGLISIMGSLMLVSLGLMSWWMASIFLISGILSFVWMVLRK